MIKIHRFEIENVKRVRALSLEPSKEGLTVIGGKNGQGKTTVLDALTWALGGDRFRPSEPTREGSATPPHLRVELDNGLVVERKGQGGSLKVIDPQGNKGGQQLLNEFIETLALDLPRFMNGTAKEKAATLLKIIGVGDKLYELETEEQRLYNKRHEIGQIADQKKKASEEATFHPDAPAEPVSASELIAQQQEILARNGENQRKRERVDMYRRNEQQLAADIEEQEIKLAEMREAHAELQSSLFTAEKTAEQLADESTAELEESIASIDATNAKVRENQAKSMLEDEANQWKGQYDELTESIESVRAEKVALLDGADLPLEGLSVEGGELTYNGHQWDSMSGSEQLRVATAIVRKLNPECGFVLVDKLEQMDVDTMREFGEWAEGEGLQVIATRVSTGDECSIVIEDGRAKAADEPPAGWKAGEF